MNALKVVVVGGGFTGLGTAAALSGLGAKVTVFETAATYDTRFRGELIHPRGVRALAQLGLANVLFDEGAVPVEGFAVTPAGDAAPMLLPYRNEAGPGLGVDHQHMVLTMRREVGRRPGVTIHTSSRVASLLHSGHRVRGVKLASGAEHAADLVVLADGRQSKLRASLGLEPDVRLLSYTVAFGVEGRLPWGRRGHVFLGAPGPILAYPYMEGGIRFCVDIPLDAPKGKAAIIEYLTERYAAAVPPALREAMMHSLDTDGFEGCANQFISTEACAAPGVVLVGDAGGCGHPLTASGMTNAMNDVLTLADVLRAKGPTDDALRDYQRRRYDFVRMRELFTDALYEVFRGRDAGSKALQRGVFQYWESSARRRNASMDILSGEDVRTSSFVTEYGRVFGVSALDVIRDALKGPALRSKTRELRSLMKTSYSRLEVAVARSARTFVDRYRLGLHRAVPTQRD